MDDRVRSKLLLMSYIVFTVSEDPKNVPLIYFFGLHAIAVSGILYFFQIHVIVRILGWLAVFCVVSWGYRIFDPH